MLKLSKSIAMLLSMAIVLSLSNVFTAKADTFYELNQTITGYTGSNQTASGAYPIIGYVAVHPKEPIQYPKDPRALVPIIPFGTMITILYGESIPTPTGNRSIFYVQDTGDTDYAKYYANKVTYRFLDVYVGEDTAYNKDFAIRNLGGITRDYMWSN